MKTIIQLTLVILGLVLGMISCQDKPQNQISPTLTKPKITVVSISVPVVSASVCNFTFDNVLKVNANSTLLFKIKLEATEQLSQYKIDVHDNFDCHTHARLEASPWRLLKIATISGVSQLVNEVISVPSDASVGNYHFMINLLDAKGNESDYIEYNVIVSNLEDTEAPQLLLNTPSKDTTTFTAGSVVTFTGTISDNKSLKNGSVEISYFNPSGTQFDVIQTLFSSSTTTSFALSETYTLPSNLSIGFYKFRITAFDEKNNKKEIYKWIKI